MLLIRVPIASRFIPIPKHYLRRNISSTSVHEAASASLRSLKPELSRAQKFPLDRMKWMPKRYSLNNSFRAFGSVVPNIDNDMLEDAMTKQSAVSIRTMLNFGEAADTPENYECALLTSAQFLHRELPVRLAHRLVELSCLPHGLAQQKSIKLIANFYERSYRELKQFPIPSNLQEEAEFTALLSRIYERHSSTIVTASRGILEFKKSLSNEGEDQVYPQAPPSVIEEDIQRWLDIFFMSRMGIRLLISQHIALHQPREGFVGIIQKDCTISDVVRSAVEDCKIVCERSYGEIPEIEILGKLDFKIDCVPSLLHHIMFEVLKNAARAEVERYQSDPEKALRKIRVIIGGNHNSEDVTIKVMDEAGGIPRSEMKRLFSYFYSTATPDPTGILDDDGEGGPRDFSTDQPMAGLGMGLPLSRLYSRFLGGDLSVLSMESYGTDAWMYIPRLGNIAEPISECAAIAAFAPSLASGLPNSSPSVDPQFFQRDAVHASMFPPLFSNQDQAWNSPSGNKTAFADANANPSIPQSHVSFRVTIKDVKPQALINKKKEEE